MTKKKRKFEDKANLGEILQSIWAPIAAIIGVIMLVIQFIQLWRGDQATVTYVVIIMGTVLVLSALIWIGFGKRPLTEKELSHPRKFGSNNAIRYPRLYLLARLGLVFSVLAVGVGVFKVYDHRQETKNKLVLLIANIDGPEEIYGFTNELLEQLDAAVKDYQDIQIIRFGQTVTVEQGSIYAREVGERYLADIVIWGWYRPTENPNISLHIENLSPQQTYSSETSSMLKPVGSLDQLESFELQQKTGTKMSGLVLFLSGFAHYNAQQYDEALSRLQLVVKSSDEPNELVNQADVLFYIANSFFYLNQFDQAVVAYTQSIQFDPISAVTYNNRGNAYLLSNQSELAISDFSQALLINSQYAGAHLNLGLAYSWQGKTDDAISELTTALQIEPEFLLAYVNRGGIYTNSGRYDLAISDLSQALEINSDYELAYYNRGVTYFYSGETDKAITDFTRAIEIDPNYENAIVNRGVVYATLREYDKAIADFTRGIEIDPKDATSFSNRGNVFSEIGKYDQALEDLNVAVALDPDHVSALFNLGVVYSRLGEYEQAIAIYQRVTQIDPSRADAYFNSANANYSLGQDEQAIELFNRAIDINPEFAEAYCNRGEVFLGLGETDKTIADYQECLKYLVDPADKARVEEYLKEISQSK